MTAHLFPVLHTRLIELLAALGPDEWALPTVAGTWTVKEVAAHLLDTQERIVARIRGESASGSPTIASPAELAAFINRINAEGVVVIKAQRFRTQEKNRVDALARLQELVERAASVPRPRKPTRPTKGSRQRRVDGKVKRGQVKAGRGKVVE